VRVAVVLAWAPPARHVGGELATLRLARFLEGRGHEVTVWATRAATSWRWGGLAVRALTAWRAVDCDVVLTHPDVGAQGWLVAQRNRCPVVGYVHNLLPQTRRALLWRPPHLTVHNSPVTAAACGDRDPLVCRPWVEPVTTATDRRVCTTAVNVSVKKGGPLVADLTRLDPDRQWLVVHGGYSDQHPMPPHVSTVGHLPHLYGVWERTRLLIFPTQFESYGMTALEAMTAGIPVVATYLPGVRDALGDAATYLPAGCPAQAWLGAVAAFDDPAVYDARVADGLGWAREAYQRACADRERTAAAIEALL
jgi:hypothetical protein